MKYVAICISLFFLQGCLKAQETGTYHKVPSLSKASCCCGQFTEIFFPNLDFESGPLPGPGAFFTYNTGTNFGGWTVTRATIDHCDPGVGNLGAGNPNGASYFVDLHGSPGLGAISYNLFGLTPGNEYRIDFWTAQNGSGFSSDGNLKIAGGAWLNVSWTVSVSGSVSWRKESYLFTAQAASATMEFSSTGPMVFQGTLVDDIKIFECPGDVEKPEVLNPPDDLMVECESQVPKAPTLQVSDNCDPKPIISFKETKETIDPCTKKIKREWKVKDACDNETIINQTIDIIDQTPAAFTKLPEDKFVKCEQDVQKEFNDWLKKNANAAAKDDCGAVTWRSSYDRLPRKYCDTLIAEFIAINPCGLESSEFATFYVVDTSAPRFTVPAQSKNYSCIPGRLDSLRNWLDHFGFSIAITNCDTLIFSHNFDGDSTKNPILVSFYAKDRCGHIDSSLASFQFRNSSDTIRTTLYSCNFSQNSFDTSVFSANGCDSVVILEKIRRLADSTFLQFNTCDPTQKLFDTSHLSNQFGCDSLVFSSYTLRSIPPTHLQNKNCAISAYSIDSLILPGQFCDSLIITENIPLRKDSSFLRFSTCDSSKAGIRLLHLFNSLGCDSIVTIQTDLDSVQVTALQVLECGLKSSYSDTLIFQTQSCDSIVITTHSALPIDSTLLRDSSCDPSKTGVFRTLLKNQYGCDSILITTVSLLPSDSVRVQQTTCDLSKAGTFFTVLKNSSGCDSVIQTNVRFLPSDTTFFNATTCDPAQQKKDTLIIKRAGCDSVVFRNIVLVPSDSTLVQQSTCQLAAAGSQTLFLKNTNGCDSIVTIRTTFIPSDTLYLNTTSCIPSLAGRDTLFLKNQAGCDSLIFRSTVLTPVRLNVLLDSIACAGQHNGKLHILNSSDFNAPLQLFLNAQQLTRNSLLDSLAPGQYLLYLRDDKGCISDSVRFSLLDPTAFTTELGQDLEVKKGTAIQLSLSANKNVTQIIWNPAHPLACQNCTDYNLVAEQDLWIYSLAFDDRGCTSLDSVFIRVLRQGNFFAPNVFSPNGDNINDYFYIQGEPGAIVEQLRIYDRWGELLFEANSIPVNDPLKGWNGSFHSDKMNPGVYAFYAKINYNNNSYFLQGDLTLIR